MRHVFIGDAGNDRHAPVAVIVGLITDLDTHYRPACHGLAGLLERVPEQHRGGFIFRAEEIWRSKNLARGWPQEDRQALLQRLMALARQLGIVSSIAAVRHSPREARGTGMTPLQARHALAFTLCAGEADRHLRENCGTELGEVIAEDSPDSRRILRLCMQALKMQVFDSGESDKVTGEGPIIKPGQFRVERLINAVHFVEATQVPVLQLADAVAFAFECYFSGEPTGETFVKSVCGPGITLPSADAAHARLMVPQHRM
ncbi:MAG: hypothetical protein ABIT61_08990 [Steroidobacteraceae bacterium]